MFLISARVGSSPFRVFERDSHHHSGASCHRLNCIVAPPFTQISPLIFTNTKTLIRKIQTHTDKYTITNAHICHENVTLVTIKYKLSWEGRALNTVRGSKRKQIIFVFVFHYVMTLVCCISWVVWEVCSGRSGLARACDTSDRDLDDTTIVDNFSLASSYHTIVDNSDLALWTTFLWYGGQVLYHTTLWKFLGGVVGHTSDMISHCISGKTTSLWCLQWMHMQLCIHFNWCILNPRDTMCSEFSEIFYPGLFLLKISKFARGERQWR